MTRLSIELPNSYPRKHIWWMECDFCQKTRSAPAWMQHDLPLSMFEAQGWVCGRQVDKCPKCIAEPGPVDPTKEDKSND